MAVAFAGGVVFAACVQVSVEKLASGRTLDFLKKRGLNKELLKKLKIKLYSINTTTVVDDAEQEQITDQSVTDLLDDELPEIEYILDEFHYEESRRNVKAEFHNTATRKEKFESQINSIIQEKLEEVEKRIGKEIRQHTEKMQELRAQIQQLSARCGMPLPSQTQLSLDQSVGSSKVLNNDN